MKKIKLLLAAMLISSAASFAQKTCNLGLTVTVTPGYSTTLNYKDTCYFDVKVTNNGTAALATTDTVPVLNKASGNGRIFPVTAPVASGASFTASKAFFIVHTLDTLKTADLTGTACYLLAKQADVNLALPGGGTRPLTVTYTDNVATNDTSCNNVILKKRPTNSILEFGSGTKEVLALYPNPAVNEVRFDIQPAKAENVIASVKDITGRTVLTKDFGKLPAGIKSTLQLDVLQLREGLYFVELSNGEKRAIGKLTIKR